jgi:hypothetical protein
MFDYRTELERRIEQFGSYLGLMNGRAHDIAETSCFMIFSECKGEDTDNGNELAESKTLVREMASEGFGNEGLFGQITSDEAPIFELPTEGWREDNSQKRFVQFSFERNWFCLDMPLQTLYRPEAEQILRDRMGFFYLRDRPEFTLYGEDVDGYDPFRKVYVYGDERSAAEDMAYIFFSAWKFPVDCRLYVRSGSFSWKHEWEKDDPIE